MYVFVAISFLVLGLVAASTARQRKLKRAARIKWSLGMQRREEADRAASLALAKKYLPMVASLAIDNAESSPYIHLPVYDCASDYFDRPCSFDEYAHRRYEGQVGFQPGHRMLEILQRIGHDTVVLCARDRVILLDSTNSENLGARVFQIVRTGVDEYFTWKWHAGYRPSAGDVDPNFRFNEMREDPDKWFRREQIALERLRHNEIYERYRKGCTHGTRQANNPT